MYFLVIVLICAAGFQIYITKQAIKDKKSLYTILGSLACIILAGVIILEFDHITG